jgi:hypothetical protein
MGRIMAKAEKTMEDCKDWKHHKHHGNRGGGMCGGVYGLAFVGAAVYFIQQSTTFWMGVLGILKALVWPALVIYKVLGLLHF